MPILQVEIVGKTAARANLAGKIADAAAEVLKAPAARVWVRLRYLSRGNYAECGGPVPRGVKPVFVDLLKASPTPVRRKKTEALALAKALARVCGRPAENVHIFYEQPAAGRAAFGGDLLEKGG
ncbi:MAG: tautomerase family protein [Elusimicrobia bacterium]|nr:tautomerase family protein [Elusimicrobiota bacterium]